MRRLVRNNMRHLLLVSILLGGAFSGGAASAQIRVMTAAEQAAYNKEMGRLDREAPRSVKLGSKAPYASVALIDLEDFRFCGRLGCRVGIQARDKAGKKVDLTPIGEPTLNQIDPLMVVFGKVEAGGMPRVTLERGRLDNSGERNEYSYDAKAKRYVRVSSRKL